MQTIRVWERTDKEGTLLLRIPLGKPEAEFEIVVVVQPKEERVATTPQERGWPPGYFESTFGSISDETFERPPQGALPQPLDW